jgi:hypothetical protein
LGIRFFEKLGILKKIYFLKLCLDDSENTRHN